MDNDIIINHIIPPSDSNRILNFLQITNDYFIPKTTSLVSSLDKYAKKISTYADVFFVECDKKDIGMCAIYMNTSVAFITSIGVINEYRKKGIGFILMDYVVEVATIKIKQSIELEVYKENLSAINFYEKNGFVKLNEYDSKIKYVKRLR